MRYTQPQSGSALVDQGSALGKALRASVVGSLKTELVRRKLIAYAAGVSQVATPQGVGLQHSTSNGNVDFGASGGLSTIVAPGKALTIFMRVYVTTLGIRQGLMTDHDVGGANESLTLEITAANQWRLSITGGASEVIGGSVTAGWHDVMAVHRPSTGNELYVDRISLGGAGFPGNLVAGSSLRLGSFGAYPLLGFAGRTAVCHIFEGDLSAQRFTLSANPWQVFRSSQNIALIVPVSGVTNTAIAPGVGVLACTGYAPTIARTANQAIAPNVGTLAITGYAPAVVITQKIAPSVGSVSITGYAPSIAATANQSIAPAVGALAITGYVVTIARTANQSVAPAVGSVAITGYAPSIAQGAGLVIAPGAGSIAIAGYAPSLAQSANQAVLTGAGAFALSGYAPAIAQSANVALTPAAGSVSISGYAPTIAQVSASLELTIVGALTIKGYEPTILQSGGAGRCKKFQVETSRGVVEVETLDEVAQIARIEKRTPKAQAVTVKLEGMKVSTPSLKPNIDYKAIEERLRAQVQAEMDDEEELLMMLL